MSFSSWPDSSCAVGLSIRRRCFLRMYSRGVYYIKKDENEVWKSGTIISDRSIRVVAFAEDLDVRRGTEAGIYACTDCRFGLWEGGDTQAKGRG